MLPHALGGPSWLVRHGEVVDPYCELPPPLRRKQPRVWRHLHVVLLALVLQGLAVGQLVTSLNNIPDDSGNSTSGVFLLFVTTAFPVH